MPASARGSRVPDSSASSRIAAALGAAPFLAASEALPGALDSEAALIEAVLADGALLRTRKEEILFDVACSRGNACWADLGAGALLAEGRSSGELAEIARGSAADEPASALRVFAARAAAPPPRVAAADVDRLRAAGASDAQILEAVQAAALSVFLCVLADGLGASAGDPPPWLRDALAERAAPRSSEGRPADPPTAPFVTGENLSADEFPPFGALRDTLGFVPRVFRTQTAMRSLLEPQVTAARILVFGTGSLPPERRELALLAAAAARDDPYGCALHAERLRGLGASEERVAGAVAGRHETLSADDAALVRFAESLGRAETVDAPVDGDARVEVVSAIAFDSFLGCVAAGLGVRPDFRAPRAELEERRASSRPAPPSEDPDAALVAAARAGDTSAFEELLRRHQARVYRTLAGLTGDPSEAEDGCQAVFLRAFRGLGEFAGASRFSTWLTRIAIREGIDRVRRRHPTERLEDVAADEDFRPSLVDPWVQDPEGLYAREEVRRLVRRELARLPLLYRAAVMLRDIEQLSTAEAAAALEIPVPTLKTRLLRGRLLLREALSAHFSQRSEDQRV